MRTEKRFTPALLARFERQGRGTGTCEDYLPWHRVGRGDPSSNGRSHLHMWEGRQRELLSDGEWHVMLFASMLPNIIDFREQQPLGLNPAQNELSDYHPRYSAGIRPSTLEIASRLGIKHPMVYGNGESCEWRMTTDAVLVLQPGPGEFKLLAISCKPNEENLSKRQKQLLSIEQTYWQYRDADWQLITSSSYLESVALTLRRNAPWALSPRVTEDCLDLAASITGSWSAHGLTRIIKLLEREIGNKHQAQCSFWQAVWRGKIPMDLNTGWRPHLPIRLIDESDFWKQNPLVSGSASCN